MLRRHNALIVHFSGAPPGSSFGAPSYPTDLHDVIGRKAKSGLACSVVMPTDNFHSPGVRNAFGCIGVIVGLTSPNSLMAVDPGDAGSFCMNGVRHYPDRDITVADLDSTILQRVEHNEWGVSDYRVLGILAVPPFEIWDHRPPGTLTQTTVSQVQREFAPLTVYGFHGGVMISPTGAISAGTLYP